MKPIYLILILPTLVAAGCASATQTAPPAEATPTQAQAATLEATLASPTQAGQATPAYPGPTTAEQAIQGYPSPGENQAVVSAYPYPVNTVTGIDIVDKVVAAAISTDHKGLSDLIHYTNAKCTRAQGLGGPPKCADNEADGTAVDVLPLIGPSEGSFIRKTDSASDFLQGQYQLLAVYKVKPDANPDPNYPAGTYGILLMRADDAGYKSLRADDQGIVRIDDEVGTLGKDFPKTDQFILKLKTSD